MPITAGTGLYLLLAGAVIAVLGAITGKMPAAVTCFVIGLVVAFGPMMYVRYSGCQTSAQCEALPLCAKLHLKGCGRFE